MPQYMYLDRVRQTGDVILVEDEEVLEPLDVDIYTPLINCEVITETGEPLGRVRDFQFSIEDGKVISIIIASIGLPQIPEQFISTYEISMEEVVSSGPNRLIVFEGAEERLTQLSVGLLERLGIGRPPWEKEEEEVYYPPTTRPENQLPTGVPLRTPVEVKKPVVEQQWDDEEWEPVPQTPASRRQAETLRYEEDEEDLYEEDVEEDNWGESKNQRPSYTPADEPDYDYEYEDDVSRDVWEDQPQSRPYNPPQINIPEKQKEKMPDYDY